MEKLDDNDYYALLGVSRNATEQEIQAIMAARNSQLETLGLVNSGENIAG